MEDSKKPGKQEQDLGQLADRLLSDEAFLDRLFEQMTKRSNVLAAARMERMLGHLKENQQLLSIIPR